MLTRSDIERYFSAEKSTAKALIATGALSIIAAGINFLLLKPVFYKGVATPPLFIGLVFLAVGYNVLKRCDEYRIRNVYALDMNPSELKEKELPRMQKVLKNFTLLFLIEVLSFVTGLVLYLYNIRSFTNDFWRGFGLALAILSLLALWVDVFAARRGQKYMKGLEGFVKQVS